MQKRPTDFPSADAFCAWSERQLALMVGGLINVLRTSAFAAPMNAAASSTSTATDAVVATSSSEVVAARAEALREARALQSFLNSELVDESDVSV